MARCSLFASKNAGGRVSGYVSSVPARDPVIGFVRLELRIGVAALVRREGAARCKAAPLGQIEQGRNHALNLVQTVAAWTRARGKIKSRNGTQQPARIGMGGALEQVVDIRLF